MVMAGKRGIKRTDRWQSQGSQLKVFHPLIQIPPSPNKGSVMSPAGTTARAYYALKMRG